MSIETQISIGIWLFCFCIQANSRVLRFSPFSFRCVVLVELQLANVTMTSKLLYSAIGRADRTLLTCGVNRQMRNFFAYLRIAFNKVDAQRLQEVGPDRLCAEW